LEGSAANDWPARICSGSMVRPSSVAAFERVADPAAGAVDDLDCAKAGGARAGGRADHRLRGWSLSGYDRLPFCYRILPF
jgi:hypothetical protein